MVSVSISYASSVDSDGNFFGRGVSFMGLAAIELPGNLTIGELRNALSAKKGVLGGGL